MHTRGRKEILDAVTIATLCAITTGLVGIGYEQLRRKLFADKAAPDSKKNES